MNLIQYLTNTNLPLCVQKLYEKGREFYIENPNYKKDSNFIDGDWIKDIFQQTSTQIISSFKSQPNTLKTFTPSHIHQHYTHLFKNKPSFKLPPIKIIKGLNVSDLQHYPFGNNCILQLSSQFNFLESPKPNIVLPDVYPFDRTQGPLGSIEATTGTLYRHTKTIQEQLLGSLHSFENELIYSNGYLYIEKCSMSSLNNLYINLYENMKILPQWVKCEASGSLQLQVFNAAPIFNNPSNIKNLPLKASIKLIILQYCAIAELACILGEIKQKTIPLHLTLIGQGVFNNPPIGVILGLKKVREICSKSKFIDIYLHCYQQRDIDLLGDLNQLNAFVYNI